MNGRAVASAPVLWDEFVNSQLRRGQFVCWHKRSAGLWMAPHRHLGVELLYCRAGQGVFLLDGEPLPYRRGTLLLFRSELAHATQVPSEYECWNLCFSPAFFGLTLGAAGEALYRSRFATLAEQPRVHALDAETQAHFEGFFATLAGGFDRATAKPVSPLLPLQLLQLLTMVGELDDREAPARVGRAPAEAAQPTGPIFTFIERHLDHPLSVEQLSAQFHYSPAHVRRLIRRATGLSPSEYIRTQRLERAKQILLGSEAAVSEIAAAVGMPSVSHFCRSFRSAVGVTPGRYRATRA